MTVGKSLTTEAITDYLIDLPTIKTHLRLEGSDLDATISDAYLPAAVEWFENMTHRAVIARDHTWILKQFPTAAFGELILPRGKTQSVSAIAYIANGSTVTLTGPSTSPIGTGWAENLTSDSGGVLMPGQGNFWPSADEDTPAPVIVTFRAGYTEATLPAGIKVAIMEHIRRLVDDCDTPDEILASAWTVPTRW